MTVRLIVSKYTVEIRPRGASSWRVPKRGAKIAQAGRMVVGLPARHCLLRTDPLACAYSSHGWSDESVAAFQNEGRAPLFRVPVHLKLDGLLRGRRRRHRRCGWRRWLRWGGRCRPSGEGHTD